MSKQSWMEVLTSAKVAGPTLTSAAAASCIPTANKITLDNNYFEVGKMLWIRAAGKISSVITTPGTARFDVQLGGVKVFDSLAILLDTAVAHTDDSWMLDIWLTCLTEGSGTSCTFMGHGTWACEDILGTPATPPKGGIVAMLPWNTAPAAGTGCDSTAALSVDLQFTQTVATGSFTLQQYAVIALN